MICLVQVMRVLKGHADLSFYKHLLAGAEMRARRR